jgi:cellulose synthase/poly-beta-1,6-N-acetylglucosamine synthase-like glycosyltransferase
MVEPMQIFIEGKLDYKCYKLNLETEFKKNKSHEFVEKIGITKGIIDNDTGAFPDYLPKHKFFIVVTMYNEEPVLFAKTMKAIHRNIESFVKEGLNVDDIGTVIIVDGIKPFYEGIKRLKDTNNKEKNYYDTIFDLNKIYEYHGIGKLHKETTGQDLSPDKMFQELLAKKYKIEKQTSFESLKNSQRHGQEYAKKLLKATVKERFYEIAHSFHCKAKFDIKTSYHVNLYFCVKHENKRKLNSHLWYFGGFCKVMNPDFCMLIDVGTEPEDRALYLLYNALQKDAQIAGVCGEIVPRNENDSIFDVLCYAQKVEYKFSHILDKAFESIIGYITVLPGAFSAYRFEALQPDNEKGPLWGDYFKSIRKPHLMDCYHANIYLAEDRVLCLSLVSAEGKRNLLRYVRRSVAYTDPPPDFEALTSQRRRWINGSWFALLDSVKNSKKILKSDHNPLRKCIFMVQMMYYVMNIIYSFVIVGCFWLALSICIRRLFDRSGSTEVNTSSDLNTFMSGLLIGYIALLIATLVLSLGSKIKDVKFAFQVISIFFSLYMGLFLVLLIKLFFDSWDKVNVLWPVLTTVFGFFMILVLNNAVWSVLIGVIQFLMATPIYINIFTIYAICNIHDVSWGNRASDLTQQEKDMMDENEKFRAGWTLLWAFINYFFAYILDAADQSSSAYAQYIYAVGIVGMSLIYVRFFGGFAHFLKQKCCKYTCIEKSATVSVSDGSAEKIIINKA